MATIDEIRANRIKKLKEIDLPYPVSCKRTHTCSQALSNKKGEIYLVGRIISIRRHGSLIFSHIQDESGKLQLLFRKNNLGEKFFNFFLNCFDVGDFIQAKGEMFKTKKGEKTLDVFDFKMLSKSLLPLPEKWHGLQDTEERYRKKYLDLIFNQEVREKFLIRAKIIKEIRNFLEKEGFLEVETPILQSSYGGAMAKPFKTHLNALKMDLYLRIAPELYLKRLLIGGFEKIYEIGRVFRNEGIDKSHNPDYTHFEFYWAYADYKEVMKMTEKMFKTFLKNIFNSLKIKHQDKEIDFKTPWQRIEFSQLLKKYTNIDLEDINLAGLEKEAKRLKVEIPKGSGKAKIADEIYKKYCRPKIWDPTFIIHHPLGFQPLAKSTEKEPKKLANFQLVVGGWELINAFSELNDPLEQEKRFKEQEKLFKKGLEDVQRSDQDFLEALEHGMPPAAGFGMGIDRLVALLTDSHSLREIILFPTMRKKK